MRLPILLLSLFFCLPVFAQNYEGKKPKGKRAKDLYKIKRRRIKANQEDRYFQAQWGYFYETAGEKTYSGFDFLNLGFTKSKKNIQKNFELEYVGFTTITKVTSTNFMGREVVLSGEFRRRRSLEFIYGHIFLLSQNKPHGFFLGPTASLLLELDKIDPLASFSFVIKDWCACIGLGFKAGYDWEISKDMTMNLTTRLTLIDAGYLRTKLENPSVPLNLRFASSFTTRLLRKQFPLMIGVRFRI